ncbi:MAG TPA: glycosyltransferase [Acidimicrobiales bacterium]|nr:glycosyltransferase [Acidimicrobiales bacterium]
MADIAPEVSVVCSTFERAHKLPPFFAALEAQTLDADRFEVVIVDDGSKDDTGVVLQRLADESKLHVRIVSFPQNQGRSKGRNAGWRAAQAPIVAFTDDDCAPDPRWLEEGLKAMTSTGATVVVGRTDPNPAQAGNTGVFSRTQRVNESSGTRYFHTCNIFYRRDALERLGGFDVGFRFKGGEDTDLGWRLLESGGTVAFANDALVLHDISKSSYRAALREASMWLDIPRVTRLHPVKARPMLVHRLFWKKTHELVLVAIGGITVAAIARNPLPLLGVIPWINFRLRRWPIGSGAQRVVYLPHAFLIDTVEVSSMVRGSVLNRVFVL